MNPTSLHVRERADGSFGIFDAEVGQIGPSFISREAAEAMLPRPQPAPIPAALRPAAGGGVAEGPVERPVEHMARLLVERAAGGGSVTREDLQQAGFTGAEIDAHIEAARARAARLIDGGAGRSSAA
ncbi:MAG: hypothetical protein RIB41_09950 [Oceanibaculum nanhaiense]|jgi:hypothetical protein|uniref:hypothetical protein n=1 Tax=Oceanibaculum nanhaiense TaxID=1909734 RepID=UPI0032EAD25E